MDIDSRSSQYISFNVSRHQDIALDDFSSNFYSERDLTQHWNVVQTVGSYDNITFPDGFALQGDIVFNYQDDCRPVSTKRLTIAEAYFLSKHSVSP